MAFFIPELWELSHVAQSREQNVNLQIMFQSNKLQQKKSYTSLLNEERKTASTAVAAKKRKVILLSSYTSKPPNLPTE